MSGLVWAVREGCEPAETKKTTRKPWEIEDGLWKRIEPLLPVVERAGRRPGRKRLENRKVMYGILFVLYAGIRWEFLPQGLAELLTGGQIPLPHRPDVTQGDSNRLTEATAGRGIALPEATTTTREIQLPLDSRGWRTATTRRPTGGRQPSSFRSARSRCRPATSPRGPNRR